MLHKQGLNSTHKICSICIESIFMFDIFLQSFCYPAPKHFIAIQKLFLNILSLESNKLWQENVATNFYLFKCMKNYSHWTLMIRFTEPTKAYSIFRLFFSFSAEYTCCQWELHSLLECFKQKFKHFNKHELANKKKSR